jgi:geranyl-CoA carboxylase alpha subunit
MRLVTAPEGLLEALRAARAEAQSAFGSGELILEKAVVRPRHVEVQIFGDSHGHVIHLGERDCSVQRRHQKVIEESPSPAVDEALRLKMGKAAVEAARASDYVGAGTVELLLSGDGSFYFLEMNTRLQVEHPVTELVTGVDLVEWQLRVAAGEPLPRSQEQIRMNGHAIEARLYAEDPAHGFMPQTGEVLVWQPAEGEDVRVDHGIRAGQVISPHYDPMLAKVVVHGASRDEARRKLAAALRETTLLGVINNKAFLAAICEHPVFASGHATTSFLGSDFADHVSVKANATSRESFAVAALLVYLDGTADLLEDPGFIGWSSGGPLWSTVALRSEEIELEMLVSAHGRGPHGRRYQVRFTAEDGSAGEPLELEVESHDGSLDVVYEDVLRRVRYARRGEELWIDDGSEVRCYFDVTHRPAQSGEGAGSGRLSAPLDGGVTKIFVELGQRVARGDLLMVLEAMKMEHRIESDVDGEVRALHATVGEQVKTRQLLVEIASAEAEGGARADAKEGA